jgi:F-type H+-transporting ATPase subunit b
MQEIFETIGFDWRMALLNLINFLIAFGILYYFLFDRIAEVIKKRQAKMNESVKNAEKIERELQEAQNNAAGIIADAKQEARDIIEEAHSQAEKLGEKMKAEANDEIESMIAKSKRQIERDKQKMYQDLREEISELIVASTEKITKQKAKGSSDKEIVDDLLEELS